MKALTVKQGWASLIFLGKDVENRTWRTLHRGPLLIHAGSSKSDLGIARRVADELGVIFPQDLSFSAVLGLVDLVDCVRDSTSPWAIPGQWHWILEKPRIFFPPISMPGKLSLWESGLSLRDVAERVRDPSV